VDRGGRKLCANARRRHRASVARDHRRNGNTTAVRPVHAHQPLGDCEYGPHQGTAADVLWRLRGDSPERRALEHEPQLSRSSGKIARTPPLSCENWLKPLSPCATHSTILHGIPNGGGGGS